MAGRKGKAGSQDGRQSQGRRTSVRDGGTTLTVSNSGLEVWLYDDADRETIRRGDASDPGFGGMPPRFEQATRQGLVVGYSLYQDDDVSVAVHVGPPLTEDELSVAHWLERFLTLAFAPDRS